MMEIKITLEDLTDRYSAELHKLFLYGDVGLYEEEERIPYEKEGIGKEYSDELFKMAQDRDFEELVYYSDLEDYEEAILNKDPKLLAAFAPSHALMVLNELKAYQFSQKLMDNFDNLDMKSDCYEETFINFFTTNQTQNIELFRKILLDKNSSVEKKTNIFYIFDKIREENLTSIENITIEFLKSDEKNGKLNDLAIRKLVDIDGLKHIDFIRECFKTKVIEQHYSTSLEQIEIDLGLKEEKKVVIQKKKEPVFIKKVVGRNDPCPCGSGKKYKKCCINKVDN